MRYLVSIICYNNSDEVIEYVEGLLKIKKEHLCFSIVINSGSNEDIASLNRLSYKYPEKIIISNPNRNLGYLNGLMHGYRVFVQQKQAPDYVIFSNTDIEIQDQFFFDKIESRHYPPKTGCIGPSIYVKSRKTYDNPVCIERRSLSEINRLVWILSIPLIRGMYVNLADCKSRFTRKTKKESQLVYEVHGCFFILSNAFAECLVKNDYGALMYSEEAYIAEMIKKEGFKTFYDSTIEVIHLEHSVTRGLKGERIAQHIRTSMKLIREEFYFK